MSTPLFSNSLFGSPAGSGTTSKKGFIPQWKEIPIASKKTANKVVQYIGPSNDEFEHGYFYYCEVNEDTPGVIVYDWVRMNVQPTGGTPTPVSYMDLEHHPSINGIVLEGNKTHTDLGLVSGDEHAQDIEDVQDLIDDVAGNSIVNIEKSDGATLGVTLTYGDETGTTENVNLDHVHTQYLVEDDLNDYATTMEVATYLEGKADKNLTNVYATLDWVLSDSTVNGVHMRVWRNNMVELSGELTSYAGAEGTLVQLPIAYKNMNYFIQATPCEMGNFFVGLERRSMNSFIVRISSASGTPMAIKFCWEAKGYIY